MVIAITIITIITTMIIVMIIVITIITIVTSTTLITKIIVITIIITMGPAFLRSCCLLDGHELARKKPCAFQATLSSGPHKQLDNK